MAAKKDLPPIIIKKKKKGHHDAHSSAWKIALADFMTTLMCFFLVMWLTTIMNTDTSKEESRFFSGAGIDPTETGIGGLLGGQTITIDGPASEMSAAFSSIPPMGAAEQSTHATTLGVYATPDEEDFGASDPFTETALQGSGAVTGDTSTAPMPYNPEQIKIIEALEDLQDIAIKHHRALQITRTPSAIHINMLDVYDKPMFALGKSTLLPPARELLRSIARKLEQIPCTITITGHTDSKAYHSKKYTNWELSTDRANATRRYLQQISPSLIIDSVVGKATHDPLFKGAPANRRISLSITSPALTPQITDRIKVSTSGDDGHVEKNTAEEHTHPLLVKPSAQKHII